MSWSIGKIIGEPARVRAIVEPQFDSVAKSYGIRAEKGDKIAGHEQVDILNVKGQVLAFLDSVPEGYVAEVEANGSRGASWLNVSVRCATLKLA